MQSHVIDEDTVAILRRNGYTCIRSETVAFPSGVPPFWYETDCIVEKRMTLPDGTILLRLGTYLGREGSDEHKARLTEAQRVDDEWRAKVAQAERGESE